MKTAIVCSIGLALAACSESGPNKGHAGAQSGLTSEVAPTNQTNATSRFTNESIAVETGQGSINSSQGSGNQP